VTKDIDTMIERAESDIWCAQRDRRDAIRWRNQLYGLRADAQLLEGDPPLAAINAVFRANPDYVIRNKRTNAAAPECGHRIYWWGKVRDYVRSHTDDELRQIRNIGERSISKLRAWAERPLLKIQDTRIWSISDLDTGRQLRGHLMEWQALDDLAQLLSRGGPIALGRLRLHTVELSKYPYYAPESYQGDALLQRVQLWASVRAGTTA